MTYRAITCAIALAAALAGCATGEQYPSASPAFTPHAQCDRDGGVWRAHMNYCEHQSPGLPFTR